jgi:hypothetical protein
MLSELDKSSDSIISYKGYLLSKAWIAKGEYYAYNILYSMI